MGGATPMQAVLDCIRKLAGHELESEPVNSILLWILPQFLFELQLQFPSMMARDVEV